MSARCEYAHHTPGDAPDDIWRCGREATRELTPGIGCYGRPTLSVCEEAWRESGRDEEAES